MDGQELAYRAGFEMEILDVGVCPVLDLPLYWKGFTSQ
jgi:hypothetical protein